VKLKKFSQKLVLLKSNSGSLESSIYIFLIFSISVHCTVRYFDNDHFPYLMAGAYVKQKSDKIKQKIVMIRNSKKSILFWLLIAVRLIAIKNIIKS
jgi:hypothetical protein